MGGGRRSDVHRGACYHSEMHLAQIISLFMEGQECILLLRDYEMPQLDAVAMNYDIMSQLYTSSH